MLRTNVRYLLLCAVRDRLFGGLLAAIALGALLAAAAGHTAPLEEGEMTISFAAASSRFVLAIGMIVFVCFHVRSQFDSREIDVMLSRPLSRAQAVVDYWMGFAASATLLVLPTLAILAFAGVKDAAGFALYGVSLLLEVWIVCALALFAALILKSAVSAVMASLAFYALARVMIYFILTSESAFVKGKHLFSETLLTLISVFVPRLDLFARSEWLVYGAPSMQETWVVLAQAAVTIPLLLAASVIDFRRKEF